MCRWLRARWARKRGHLPRSMELDRGWPQEKRKGRGVRLGRAKAWHFMLASGLASLRPQVKHVPEVSMAMQWQETAGRGGNNKMITGSAVSQWMTHSASHRQVQRKDLASRQTRPRSSWKATAAFLETGPATQPLGNRHPRRSSELRSLGPTILRGGQALEPGRTRAVCAGSSPPNAQGPVTRPQ